jgi:hypothetical protein
MKSTLTNGVEVFNPLDHGIHNQPLMVSASDYNKLLELTAKLEKCLGEMRNEYKLHGQITDASAQYMIVLKPLFEEIVGK